MNLPIDIDMHFIRLASWFIFIVILIARVMMRFEGFDFVLLFFFILCADYGEFKPRDVGPFPVQQILPYEGSYIIIVEITLSVETDECEGGMPATETFTKAQVFEVILLL